MQLFLTDTSHTAPLDRQQAKAKRYSAQHGRSHSTGTRIQENQSRKIDSKTAWSLFLGQMVSLLSVVITLDRLWTASSVILHVKTTQFHKETSLELLLHYTAVSVCVVSEDSITFSKTKLYS